MHSGKHVVLNGVKYFLDQGVEGVHFVESFEPLRPSASQVVQGENKFNLRPDVLVWSWTDWSGGAGQFKWDPQAPNRYYDGAGIDPFTAPGNLQVARALEVTDNNASSDFVTAAGVASLVVAGPEGVTYMFNEDDIYTWAATKWSVGAAVTGVTGAINDVVADQRYLWIADNDSVIRRDSVGTTVDMETGLNTVDELSVALASVGNSLFRIYHDASGLHVREWIKSATPPSTGTVVYSNTTSTSPLTGPLGYLRRRVATSHNRVYIATPMPNNESEIVEIIPTTSAGTGFGRFVGVVPMNVTGMVWHGGLLYMHSMRADAVVPSANETSQGGLMYLNPVDGTYGVVDLVRPLPELGASTLLYSMLKGAPTLGMFFFAVHSSSRDIAFVLAMDSVLGSLHTYATIETPASETLESIVLTNHGLFVTFMAGNIHRTTTNYQTVVSTELANDIDPYVISSVWDGGTLEDKIINSFRIVADTIPTGWTVELEYQVDESGSWVSAGTIVATEEDKDIVLSSPAVFKRLQLRLNFQFSGTPTATPVIRGVETRVTIGKFLHSWNLLLSMSDDRSHTGSSNKSGAKKQDNLRTLASSGVAFVFQDAYTTRPPGAVDSYTVTMDSAAIREDRMGEGVAQVRLVEVA